MEIYRERKSEREREGRFTLRLLSSHSNIYAL